MPTSTTFVPYNYFVLRTKPTLAHRITTKRNPFLQIPKYQTRTTLANIPNTKTTHIYITSSTIPNPSSPKQERTQSSFQILLTRTKDYIQKSPQCKNTQKLIQNLSGLSMLLPLYMIPQQVLAQTTQDLASGMSIMQKAAEGMKTSITDTVTDTIVEGVTEGAVEAVTDAVSQSETVRGGVGNPILDRILATVLFGSIIYATVGVIIVSLNAGIVRENDRKSGEALKARFNGDPYPKPNFAPVVDKVAMKFGTKEGKKKIKADDGLNREQRRQEMKRREKQDREKKKREEKTKKRGEEKEKTKSENSK